MLGDYLMTRSDFVISLVQTAFKGDMKKFRMTVEAIIAEARGKNHHVIANQLQNIISKQKGSFDNVGERFVRPAPRDTIYQFTPAQSLNELILSNETKLQVLDFIEEHGKRDLLRSYNLEPKNRILFYGPPGNGKTSLAGALAEELAIPMYVLKYEDMMESYLGKTAKKLNEAFEFVKQENCQLFLDEFESIAKERGDAFDNGEIKRIVSSLLLQIDKLPSHVVLVAATNHTQLVDKAFWRRFQMHINLSNPNRNMIKKWFELFQSENKALGLSPDELSVHFKGCNFSDVESFALDVMRKFVLQLPDEDIKNVTLKKIKQWKNRIN